ncbi:hypothetical protein J437_LFUL010465 [Ladona fulva]|uniref:Uncharacterized protein n=1 Tax=Ladona fulva TaxID=123851 RepID=A0A8K0P748_LADFU|nr:hypothetical protein J437_LFUL010465 [Ladona fulva]
MLINVYVYTDIIKPQIVGDTLARCLRVLNTKLGLHQTFNQIYYFPVEKKNIEVIECMLANKLGETVPFHDGEQSSIVVLHFYKKKQGGELGTIYRASYRMQKGRGIGSFLAGLWRFAKPLIYSGLKTVGKEAPSSTSKVITDFGTKPIKEILRTRLSETRENLKRKAEEKLKTMSGGGVRMTKRPRLNKIKSSANKMRRHSMRKRRRDRIVQRDIFST